MILVEDVRDGCGCRYAKCVRNVQRERGGYRSNRPVAGARSSAACVPLPLPPPPAGACSSVSMRCVFLLFFGVAPHTLLPPPPAATCVCRLSAVVFTDFPPPAANARNACVSTPHISSSFLSLFRAVWMCGFAPARSTREAHIRFNAPAMPGRIKAT